MKIINTFLKKKLNFFTLNDTENMSNNNGILILDTSFFIILPLTIDIIEDAREREMEIDDKIEELIEGYSSFDYISKEISLREENGEETILIILIERQQIEDVILKLKAKKILLSGIYPLFLLEFFNKEEEDKTYIEIQPEYFRLYTYKNKKLFDFNEVEFPLEELLGNKEYLIEYLQNDYIFTYESENNDIYSNFEFIKFREWNKYQLLYDKNYDFLPKQYQDKLKLKHILKILVICSCIFIITESIFSLLLNVYIANKKEVVNTLQEKIISIDEKIKNQKEEINKIQNEISLIEKQNKEEIFNTLHISEILNFIMVSSDNININSIEYTNKHKIKITGTVISDEDFYSFEKRLLSHKLLAKINHDFLNFQDKYYDFNLEIEVGYDS